MQEAVKSQITCSVNKLKSAMEGLHLCSWRNPLQRLVEAGCTLSEPAKGHSHFCCTCKSHFAEQDSTGAVNGTSAEMVTHRRPASSVRAAVQVRLYCCSD